jgi:hypothetical protein
MTIIDLELTRPCSNDTRRFYAYSGEFKCGKKKKKNKRRWNFPENWEKVTWTQFLTQSQQRKTANLISSLIQSHITV